MKIPEQKMKEKVGTTSGPKDLQCPRTNNNPVGGAQAARAARVPLTEDAGEGLGEAQAARVAWVPPFPNQCPCHSFILTLLFLFITTFKTANDIELNPGPPYPCGVCSKQVGWNKPAIACDECSTWFHKGCLQMPNNIFQALSTPNASWICCNCGMPTFTTSLFDSFDISTSNNYDTLANNPSALDDSMALLQSEGPGPPLLTSSPRQQRGRRKNPGWN
jgi:hypothetical protein